MVTLLIVDDEALETEALSRILRAEYGDTIETWTAFNGTTAIALAEAHRPDIVLMDIEMPGVNGLDAARVIRDALPRCRVIIVTAYERFQYAQQAIALGSSGYLLKPVATADLLAMVSRVLSEVAQDRYNEKRRAALDQLTREQFVVTIVSGYADAASLGRQLAELGVTFGYGFCAVLRGADGESASLYAGAACKALPDAFDDGEMFIFEYDDRLMVAGICHTPFCGEAAIHVQMRAAVDAVRRATGVCLLAGVGMVVTSLSDMQGSYDAALEALAAACPDTPVRALTPEAAQRTSLGRLERRLYACVLERDLVSALLCMETALDTMAYTLTSPEAVLSATSRLLASVARKIAQDAQPHADLTTGIGMLTASRCTQAEAAVRVRGLLVGWIDALNAQPALHTHRIRSEIKRYLQAHFDEDLSIKRVAQAMHYSEPYFSKLFTRCFHTNFVTYLTDLRMQAARRMLEDTAKSIREISAAVGFSDANYFAKVFRKAYGVSPSEFRRMAYGLPEGGVSE